MVRLPVIVFILALAALLPAFHQQTDRAIVQKVAEWGPRDALVLFKDYNREFWRGFEKGRTAPAATHHEILILTDKIIKDLDSHVDMGTIVESWGMLSSRILRVTDPTMVHSSEQINKKIQSDFPQLVLRKQKKMPVIFYGFDSDFFNGNRMALLYRLSKNQEEWMRLLWMDYQRLEPKETFRSFDDRGNAFGVVSFTLNHSFTTLLHFWYYIWRHAGGRMGPLTLNHTSDKTLVVANGY